MPSRLAAVAATWAVLLAASATSTGSQLHGYMMPARITPGSVLAFLAAWELMAVAMMLPGSLAFFSLFGHIVRLGDRLGTRRAAAHAGYWLMWAAIGCVTLALSFAVHGSTSADLWLSRHAGLLAGAVLIVAGAFQLTPFKQRCLSVCSRPESFLMRHYRGGMRNALELGVRYGLICAGCCWALMVLMVVLGAGSLYAMAALAAVMLGERTLGWSGRFARMVGGAGVALGALAIFSPEAVPALAGNAASWAGMGAMQLYVHGQLLWCHA